MEQKTLENNILISRLFGEPEYFNDHKAGRIKLYFKPGHNTPHCRGYELSYHSDWNWLMPAFEKVCRLKVGDGVEYVEYSDPRTFGMVNKETGQIMVRLNGFGLHESDTLIEAVFQAVVEFLEWYNLNK